MYLTIDLTLHKIVCLSNNIRFAQAIAYLCKDGHTILCGHMGHGLDWEKFDDLQLSKIYYHTFSNLIPKGLTRKGLINTLILCLKHAGPISYSVERLNMCCTEKERNGSHDFDVQFVTVPFIEEYYEMSRNRVYPAYDIQIEEHPNFKFDIKGDKVTIQEKIDVSKGSTIQDIIENAADAFVLTHRLDVKSKSDCLAIRKRIAEQLMQKGFAKNTISNALGKWQKSRYNF